jgi:yeast amino acid transporter
MAVMYPLLSATDRWTGKFVDSATAFLYDGLTCFSFCVTIANELSTTNTFLGLWTGKVPITA